MLMYLMEFLFLQNKKMEGNVGMGLIGENFDSGLLGRLRDDDYESRSGSENFDDLSGDDLDVADDQPKSKKKKKYHRHTPQQIQELETYDFMKLCDFFQLNVIDYLWFNYSLCL